MAATRQQPNILITGTPGTGKSTLSELVAQRTGLTHIQVGKLVKDLQLHDGKDEEFDSYVLNDDKLLDELEDQMEPGGQIVDFHSCDLFPERWFDLVVVLQTDNSVLFQRLQKRGYNQKKVEENIECEIMQVVLDEAVESYQQDIILTLPSDTVDQMEDNAQRIEEWIRQFTPTSQF
ncbi:factor activating pos9 [Dimargaris xerosporica]|nr:factor activating pos9 [Dimargaris xerosporica]